MTREEALVWEIRALLTAISETDERVRAESSEELAKEAPLTGALRVGDLGDGFGD